MFLTGSLPWGLPIRKPVPVTAGCGMLQQLWSFNPFSLLLTALTHGPSSKRGCQLQREGKNKTLYALGQRCQYSLICWNMLSLWRSLAWKPTICNLAAGIAFQFIYSELPWKWQHPSYCSRALRRSPFCLVYSGITAEWCRKDGEQGESLARIVQIGRDVLRPRFNNSVRHTLVSRVKGMPDVKWFTKQKWINMLFWLGIVIGEEILITGFICGKAWQIRFQDSWSI